MTGDIDVVPARAADAATIAYMSKQLIEHGLGWSWTPARIGAAIRARDTMVIVAVNSNRRIEGFAIMAFGDDYAHLNLLAVHPRCHRQGIGRALVQWLEKSARVAGLSQIRLELRASNQGAQQFYAQLGFAQGAIISGYYSGKEAARRMVRDLRESATDAG